MSFFRIAEGRFSGIERVSAWTLLLLFAGMQAVTFADRLNPDGIAYLDVAAAYVRGDWETAVNPYWSPALSWLLALLHRPLDIVGCGGLGRIHALLIGIFALALWCFERLVVAVGEDGGGTDPTLRGWRWLTYGLFGIVTLKMIGVVWLTPDLLLLGVLCLASAFGLRLLGPKPTRATSVGFGLLLGLAYWIKSPFFPLGFVFLATAWALLPRRRGAVGRAAVVFILTTSLWAVPLSVHQGRPTFGDAGRLNAAWFLGSVPTYTHWYGGDGTGTPAHPLERAEGTDAFVFPAAFPEVTYPPWYAPAHWYEGARYRVRASNAVRNASEGLYLLIGSAPIQIGVASIVLAWLVGRPRRDNLWRPPLLLVIPASVGLGGYLLIHTELRLAAPLVLLGWIGLMAIPGFRTAARRKGFAAACLCFAGVMALPLLLDAGRQADWFRSGVTPGRAQDCAVAAELVEIGLDRSDGIAVVGDASAAAWAWIGGFRIVGDMPEAGAFWSLAPEARSDLARFFAAASARAIVAPHPDGSPRAPSGWHNLGSSGLLVRLVDRDAR